jgi:GWxTD domain-containing protein
VAGVLLVPAPSRADKLDKESKAWLDGVAPILLQEEDKAFKSLKDKADRDEFQKIFWARRNPAGPAAPDNTFKAEYEQKRAQLDKDFASGNKPGSATDCARVFTLIGTPNEITKAGAVQNTSNEGGGLKMGGMMNTGQTWTYKDRPGFTFTGGQIQIMFEPGCVLPAGGAGVLDQLNRVAESKVVSPNIGYEIKDGKLTRKLVDMLPKPTPLQALLKEPRQDFVITAETKLLMRGKDGTYLGGLVHGAAAGLTVQDEAGKKHAPLTVAAQALDENGKVVASTPEQETAPELTADGSFVGSYGITLKPGKYTIRAGALDAKTGKGSVATLPVEIPDFNAPELKTSELVLLSDVIDKKTQDVKDPLAAFFLGSAQLVPRFGNVFAPSEALQALAFVYGAQVDPATSKTSITARFAILKDGKTPVSQSGEQPFDTAIATPGIGPVPLEKFAPGKYMVKLTVTDQLAKKDYVKEAGFEVKP